MVGRLFDASVIFEANIEVNGNLFLTIYGSHANGYFIAIPNWGVCCEAASAEDVFYNAEKLRSVKLSEKSAHLLANAIKQMVAKLRAEQRGVAV
ncbi:MAG: hypothetical protein IJ329_00795 [Clostridia bacterium]|nr:hypothetical protein [Clostridia bacterium]